MKKIFYLPFLYLGLILNSCQNVPGNKSKTPVNSNPVNAAISPDEFEKKLRDTAAVQLVDVRTPEEFNQGHLKGAVNFNFKSQDFENQIGKLRKDKPVLVYCLSGGRSSSAAKLLGEKGFSEIYNMQGGLMKWKAANKPTDNGSASETQLGLSMEDFNHLIQKEKYVLVDYNAKWCVPCQHMAPMLESFAEKRKDKLSLVKIDADENKGLFKVKNIESIPVLELYKDGKLIWKHEGELDEPALLRETKL